MDRRASPAAGGPDPVAAALLGWFRRVRRPLPWRSDRDPYRIWVAEVLLQQTRVAQAVPYFSRFVARFPDVRALARARSSEVLKAWEGAGYYARARHLHVAARRLVAERGGRIPDTVAELETLPGVGPYIARAVASLAFGRPVVAVEANGLRVAARWTLERRPVSDAAARTRLVRALETRLPAARAGEFNEAVMELGETVCTPRLPRCPICPVAFACRTRRTRADPARIPARARRPARPLVRAAVVVLEDPAGRWLVQRRPPRGLLGGLWEFPGGKIGPRESPEAAGRRELREETGYHAGPLEPLGVVRHAHSHFAVELHVFRGRRARRAAERPGPDRRWANPGAVVRLPLPTATAKIVRLLRSEGTASQGSGSRRGRTSASPPRARRPRRLRARARRTTA